MPVGGGEVEEVDVPGGMTPAAKSIIPLCCLGGWTAGCEGDCNPEKYSQSPGHKVTATLIEDVRLRQE